MEPVIDQTPDSHSQNSLKQNGNLAIREQLLLIRDLIPLLLIVLIVFAGVRIFFQPYKIVGASMSPTLSNGERLLVNRTAYSHVHLPALGEFAPFSTPQRGDIIVLDSDATRRDEPYIKRIIALPGETITFLEGIVMIDGEPLVEDYIEGAITRCGNLGFCSVTVPAGFVYVLGDNRTNSEDSRYFGPIPVTEIVGRAYFSNWPYDSIGPIPHPDYSELPDDR